MCLNTCRWVYNSLSWSLVARWTSFVSNHVLNILAAHFCLYFPFNQYVFIYQSDVLHFKNVGWCRVHYELETRMFVPYANCHDLWFLVSLILKFSFLSNALGYSRKQQTCRGWGHGISWSIKQIPCIISRG